MQLNTFMPENFLILIVDDITHNLKLVGKMLDDAGYNTTFATSGLQAFERIKNNKTDLILLDLMMPEIDGFEVCKILKNDLLFQDIPIIFLTASHEQDHLIDAFEAGAVDYITKPYIKNELLARVKTHLTLKHTTDTLKNALLQLEQLAQLDPLTQVLNRRRFFEVAEAEFESSIQAGKTFSLLLLDLDHFKKINHDYGHLIGDHALIQFTSVIRNHIKDVDHFGRYGGEEFVLLLPETTLEDAVKVAQQICSLIGNLSIPTEKGNLQMTVSIGIAISDSQDTRIEEIFDRADQSLYQAKAQGHNTYCVYQFGKNR